MNNCMKEADVVDFPLASCMFSLFPGHGGAQGQLLHVEALSTPISVSVNGFFFGGLRSFISLYSSYCWLNNGYNNG